MAQPAHDSHLAGEALRGLRITAGVDPRAGAAAQDRLDGHDAFRAALGGLQVLGAMDLPHVAPADDLTDAEPAADQPLGHCHSLVPTSSSAFRAVPARVNRNAP